MFNSEGSVKGTVNIILRGPDNRVKKHKTIRNKVMDLGIAHIVGRMIDTKQNGKAFGTNGTVNSTAAKVHDFPMMMRYMGLGEGAGSGTFTANADDATHKGKEWRLQGEITSGTNPQDFYNINQYNNLGNSGGKTVVEHLATRKGRVDMGNNLLHTLVDPTSTAQTADLVALSSGTISPVAYDTTSSTGGSYGDAAKSADWRKKGVISRADVTDLFQGENDASGILQQSEGKAEATAGSADNATSTAESSAPHTWQTTKTGTGAWAFTGKRVGTKLVYIALFPPNTPYHSNGSFDSGSTTVSGEGTASITEAGIFNGFKDGLTTGNFDSPKHRDTSNATGQTMLCRTTFAVVNKFPADSLQITWTIDFSDATT